MGRSLRASIIKSKEIYAKGKKYCINDKTKKKEVHPKNSTSKLYVVSIYISYIYISFVRKKNNHRRGVGVVALLLLLQVLSLSGSITASPSSYNDNRRGRGAGLPFCCPLPPSWIM